MAYVRATAERVYGRRDLLVCCCGSFRRGKATTGDVDILISPQTQRGAALPLGLLIDRLTAEGFVIHHLRLGGSSFSKKADVPIFDPGRDSRWSQIPVERKKGGAAGGAGSKRDRPWGDGGGAGAAAAASAAPPPPNLPDNFVPWDKLEKLPSSDYEHESFMGMCRLPSATAGAASSKAADGAAVAAAAGIQRVARRIDIKSYPRDIWAFALM